MLLEEAPNNVIMLIEETLNWLECVNKGTKLLSVQLHTDAAWADYNLSQVTCCLVAFV